MFMYNFEYAHHIDSAFKPSHPLGYHLIPGFYLFDTFKRWLKEEEGIYE